MNDFTYETKNLKTTLETYEWDNMWWEQASDTTRPRVLYIGDSISCGIRRIATAYTGEKILFDGLGTSKAVDHPYYKDAIRYFANQQPQRKLVLFNNGLHGFHLEDEKEYGDYYEKMVKFLLGEFKETVLALILTTHVAGDRNTRVIRRNAVVKEIAQKYNLPIIDLYFISVEYSHFHSVDGVHFTDAGYQKLAGKLVESIYEICPQIE